MNEVQSIKQRHMKGGGGGRNWRHEATKQESALAGSEVPSNSSLYSFRLLSCHVTAQALSYLAAPTAPDHKCYLAVGDRKQDV
jgi:hypothetical protein